MENKLKLYGFNNLTKALSFNIYDVCYAKTEREQRELKTLLDRARIAHGRLLTNAETNSIKKEYIDKLMALREAEAKKARQLKKKQAYKPDAEASFSWSANTPTRGRR